MAFESKKLNINVRDRLIKLASGCFWYWNTFYSFLDSAGVPRDLYLKIGKEGRKPNAMRAILYELEEKSQYGIIKQLVKQFYELKPSDENIDQNKANEMLEEFRNILGSSVIDDQVAINERQKRIDDNKLAFEKKTLLDQKLEKIKNDFLDLHSAEDKQRRGFELEKLFFDLLEVEEFECTRPFRNPGEQIDGHFKYKSFDYLVEIKWTESLSDQSNLSTFDGKITGKAQSTRGLFFSVSGFNTAAISKVSGDARRILLMDGRDLFAVLERRTTFYDLMDLKTDALARKGEVLKIYGS